VGGSLEAILTSGDKDQYKHLVIVLAAHECEAVTDVQINGESLGALECRRLPDCGQVREPEHGEPQRLRGVRRHRHRPPGRRERQRVALRVDPARRRGRRRDLPGRDAGGHDRFRRAGEPDGPGVVHLREPELARAREGAPGHRGPGRGRNAAGRVPDAVERHGQILGPVLHRRAAGPEPGRLPGRPAEHHRHGEGSQGVRPPHGRDGLERQPGAVRGRLPAERMGQERRVRRDPVGQRRRRGQRLRRGARDRHVDRPALHVQRIVPHRRQRQRPCARGPARLDGRLGRRQRGLAHWRRRVDGAGGHAAGRRQRRPRADRGRRSDRRPVQRRARPVRGSGARRDRHGLRAVPERRLRGGGRPRAVDGHHAALHERRDALRATWHACWWRRARRDAVVSREDRRGEPHARGRPRRDHLRHAGHRRHVLPPAAAPGDARARGDAHVQAGRRGELRHGGCIVGAAQQLRSPARPVLRGAAGGPCGADRPGRRDRDRGHGGAADPGVGDGRRRWV
jgi:hypothetical protein